MKNKKKGFKKTGKAPIMGVLPREKDKEEKNDQKDSQPSNSG